MRTYTVKHESTHYYKRVKDTKFAFLTKVPRSCPSFLRYCTNVPSINQFLLYVCEHVHVNDTKCTKKMSGDCDNH